MAAGAASGRGGNAGNPSPRLEDHAAAAALLADRSSHKPSHPFLDENGKLSSAGAAASFKYAQPEDLPSYPSPGLQIASAGAAASLAESNKKPVELWKAGSIPAAERAAFLAKDYEAEELWQPELSTAGSRAALRASDSVSSPTIWKPGHLDDGHSAAAQAVRRSSPKEVDHRAVPSDAGRKALLAATGAMASSRRRADSAPADPMSKANPSHAQWALKAATQSQRRGPNSAELDSPGFNASRIQNIAQNNVSRQMYTSHPPVSIETEEKNRQDTLRASAVAMAQTMFAIQQKAIDEAKADVGRSDSQSAARNVHNRRISDVSTASVAERPKTASMQYSNNLQEAAQKLAQERLAKMRDERGEYMQYYGQKSSARSRLSMTSKLRRRASSDGAVDKIDEEQSKKIRSQMSTFQTSLAAVDEKKRQQDRSALAAAAQRNVRASMHSLDEEVFQQTGKSSPAQREEWAAQARKKAQADSEARMQNFGKVHIGGGKYIDQADVDATAKARIQPHLDEINDRVETRKAQEAELQMEQEQQRRKIQTEKQRLVDLKDAEKRAKEEDKQDEKARKKAYKEEIAIIKEREKLVKEEEALKARIEKDQLKAERNAQNPPKEKTKDKLVGLISPISLSHKDKDKEHESKSSPGTGTLIRPKASKVTSTEKAETAETAEKSKVVAEEPSTTRSSSTSLSSTPNDETAVDREDLTSPASPSTGGRSKVKSWFSKSFRRSSRVEGSGPVISPPLEAGSASRPRTGDTARSDSERNVALAGVTTESSDESKEYVAAPVSPLKAGQATRSHRDGDDDDEGDVSSLSSDEEFEDASEKNRPRTDPRGLKDRLLEKISLTGTGTGAAGAEREDEKKEMQLEEEKKDRFDEAGLIGAGALDGKGKEKEKEKEGGKDETVGRESRFSENL